MGQPQNISWIRTPAKPHFEVPAKEGWYTTQLFGGTGYLFVPNEQDLQAWLSTATESYRPGTEVNLQIDVSINDQPTKICRWLVWRR